MAADFTTIKERVPIDKVVTMLGLTVKKEPASLRCECPVHGGGPRSLAITVNRNVFYCMSARKGGSAIDLVAHIKECSLHEAGDMIAKHFNLDSASTAPQPRKEKAAPAATGNGLKELDYLDPLHEAVEALGVSPATADILGIGYADKGTMKGYVLFPLRHPDSTLVGYMGVALDKEPRFKFPSNLDERTTNVVPFEKKMA